MSAAPDYSVVIPCYNEEAFLPATLAAARAAMQAMPQRGEIVVTDNDSTDASAEIARAAGAQVVFEEHRQISRARNVGAHAARGRYLIFVDADTLISPELLRATLAALELGTVCGGGTAVTLDLELGRLARLSVAGWNFMARSVGLACGAYFYCLRDAFVAVGGFPENVYATEEIWLSRALQRYGRSRGLAFRILREPIVTSARKLRWYGARGVGRAMLRLMRPSALRSREACALWYARPEEKDSASEARSEP
jgi:glycosyltransferase involved in cell wall biosynthesis